MAASGKITLDIKDYEAKLRQIDKLTAQVASNSGKNFSKIGNNNQGMKKFQGSLSKAGSLASALGSQVGGVFSQLGNVISSIASGPIAIFTAAIGAIIAIGTKVYDMLTESAEEYAAKVDGNIEKHKQEGVLLEEQDKAAADYMNRIKELNSIEQSGNATKGETLQILKVLESQYGNLGAVVDETTGKISNLDAVEARLNKKRNQRKAGNLQQQSNDMLQAAEASFMKTKGNEWFTTESGAKDIFRDLMQKKGIDGTISELENIIKNSTDADEIKGYQDVVKKLREAKALQDKSKNVSETGHESQEEYQKSLNDKAKGVSAAKAKGEELDKQAERKQSDREYNQADTITAKIQNREKILTSEKSKQAEIQKEIAEAQAQLNRAEKPEQKLDAQKRLLDAQNKLKQKNGEILDIENQIADLQKQRDKAYQDINDSLDEQIERQKLINAGKTEEAERQKIINDLKKQGIDADPAKVDEIMRKKRDLGSANLQGNQIKQAESLYDKALRAMGKNKEADLAAALKAARDTKGSDLTQEEEARTKKLVELQNTLSGLSENKDNRDTVGNKILTNSLTARGGFQGGAVMPGKDSVQRSINSKVDKIKEIMDEIKKLQNEMKDTVEKGLKV